MIFLEKEIVYIQSHYEEIVQEIVVQMNRCLGSIIEKPIDLICISFMHTSLFFLQPKFRVSFFQAENLWEHAECEMEISADWLFHEWKGEPATETEILKERNEIKSALIYASCVFKYALYNCSEFKNYSSLNRREELCIMFGEYKDWQYPIYWEKKEVDIFNNRNKDKLEFTRFNNKVYSRKTFRAFPMKQSRFMDCRFDHCRFDKTDLSDGLFVNCEFENIVFDQCTLYGITFDHCRFEKTTIQDCVFTYQKQENKSLPGIYQTSRFLECNVEQIDFKNSEISEVWML